MAEDVKPKDAPVDDKAEKYLIDPEEAPSKTEHSLALGKKTLKYEASAGMLALRNPLGDVRAGIFHTAYTVPSEKPRPITFTFNGGPGSSSVWLHLGAVGPRKVHLTDEGMAPKPPFKLVENPESWLPFTDLVFIDPVGTGFSRAVKKADEKEFWGLKGDIESVGDFIRTYLNEHHRWGSPVYLAGESYGTTRAAGLSDYLFSHGVGLNGIVLVSSILNFQTARFTKGNDLPYILFLPTYCATAWYHKQLPADLQRKPLTEVLREVEAFAMGEYQQALLAGDALTEVKRAQVFRKLARFTGLDAHYTDLADLRINIHRFCKELLRKERRTVGRLDSRYKGIDAMPITEMPDYDPSSSEIGPAFTACINDYLRRELKFESKLHYNVSAPGELWRTWDWGSAGAGYPDTSEALRASVSKNKHMGIFVASGYYDLATPYFATEYTLSHMGLDPEVRGNFSEGFYEAGHMMYVRSECLHQLRVDVEEFYGKTL